MSDFLNRIANSNGTSRPKSLNNNTNNTGKAKGTEKTTKDKNLVVEDKNKSVKVEDFLKLMIAQLKNQDFMNPMDDTQYVTQLAQFSSMQQMQELAYNSKANFMSSLVGKQVTASKLSLGGNVNKTTGVVSKLSIIDGKFNFYIDGSDKAYTFDQIMEIHAPNKNSKKLEHKPTNDDNKIHTPINII